MNFIKPNSHTQQNPIVSMCGERTALCGTIYKIRRMSGFAFLILQTETTLVQCVWSQETALDIPEETIQTLRKQSSVRVTGTLRAEPRAKSGFELMLHTLCVLSVPYAPAPVVINGRKPLSLETDLLNRPFSLRREETRAVFRIQSALTEGCTKFFAEHSFTQIHTPKLCSGTAESGAGVFPVDYFGREAFLATSPQLYKQMMVGVFGRVYEIGPVFRAEHHDTARHLNEYTGIDCEVGFIHSTEQLMEIECALLSAMFAYVGEHVPQALSLLSVSLPDTSGIPAVPFSQAKALLRSYGLPGEENDLSPAEEKKLSQIAMEHWNSEFVFVTQYPAAKRPFYTMEHPEDPCVTESFDLLFRGMEITTGGRRIHDYTQQIEKMRKRGISPEPFTDYLSAHKYGLPPHGGFGIGLERLCACLCGFDNVRHASLFPRDVSRLTP